MAHDPIAGGSLEVEHRQTCHRKYPATHLPEMAGPAAEPLDLDNLRARHFRPALARAEIARPVRVYELRHGFATAALEAGAGTRTVAYLMGHSSTRTTLDVYQHVSDERKRAAADVIAARLSR